MRIFTQRAFTLWAALSLLVVPRGAFPTTVRAMNLPELVGDAQYVVKAQVVSKDVVQDTEESGMIVSYYTLQILEWLKGEPTGDGQLVIKQVGQGRFTVGGYRIRQNYFFPDYEVGRTYVLFLPEAHPVTGLLAPVGLSQGVFEVVSTGGEESIPQLKSRRSLLEGRLATTAAARTLKTRMATAAENPTYANFKSMIQAAGE